jgi:hypothetical protein
VIAKMEEEDGDTDEPDDEKDDTDVFLGDALSSNASS